MKKNPLQVLQPSQVAQDEAKFLAMVVRNAMEDFHHEHLSDEQMRELNPIIRNAIYTGLQVMKHYHESKGAKAFAEYHAGMVPKYWESPELLADLVETVKRMNGTGSA